MPATLCCRVDTWMAFGMTKAVIRFSTVITSPNGIMTYRLEAPRGRAASTLVTQPRMLALKERCLSLK